MKLKYFDELKKAHLRVGVYTTNIHPKNMSFMQLKNYHCYCSRDPQEIVSLKDVYCKYKDYDVVGCEYRKGTMLIMLSKECIEQENDGLVDMIKLANGFDTFDIVGLVSQIRYIVKYAHPKLSNKDLKDNVYQMIIKKDFQLENKKRYI